MHFRNLFDMKTSAVSCILFCLYAYIRNKGKPKWTFPTAKIIHFQGECKSDMNLFDNKGDRFNQSDETSLKLKNRFLPFLFLSSSVCFQTLSSAFRPYRTCRMLFEAR